MSSNEEEHPDDKLLAETILAAYALAGMSERDAVDEMMRQVLVLTRHLGVSLTILRKNPPDEDGHSNADIATSHMCPGWMRNCADICYAASNDMVENGVVCPDGLPNGIPDEALDDSVPEGRVLN